MKSEKVNKTHLLVFVIVATFILGYLAVFSPIGIIASQKNIELAKKNNVISPTPITDYVPIVATPTPSPTDVPTPQVVRKIHPTPTPTLIPTPVPQETYTGEPLVSCVLSYGVYMITASSCESLKKMDKEWTISDPAPINTVTPTPTITEEQAQALIDQYNSEVQRCQDNVVNKYQSLMQGCTRYGGSAYQVCVQEYSKQRDAEYNSCG